jgi:ferritin-like protein
LFLVSVESGTTTDKNLGIHESVQREDKCMPSEILDVEKFVAMSAHAKYCSVKRLKETVKLKLRTPSKLYTLKVEPLKAEETIKKLKCEIREL